MCLKSSNGLGGIMVNNTVMLEYEKEEKYETSALALTYYSTEPMHYKTAKKIETATTDIISEEIILKTIKEFIERIVGIIDVETTVRALEKSIKDCLYLFNEVRIGDLVLTPSWVKIIEKKYPETVELSRKLRSDEELTRIDKWNLNEITKASGWDKEDVIEDLKNLDVDPSERETKYWDIFEKYYKEAEVLKNKGDNPQAAEKLWGAITVLIKAYSAKMGIFVAEWDHETLWNVVYHNFGRLKPKFRELLKSGRELHIHFYEKHLPSEAFEETWNECVKLIKEILSLIKV